MVFHCSPSLLDYADQAVEDLPAGVSLIQSENGQKRLTFQQNLQIHYSNNSQQVRNQIGGEKGEKEQTNNPIPLSLCSLCLSAPTWSSLR